MQHRDPRGLLLICDYPSGLLDNLSEILEYVGITRRFLIRKKNHREWRDSATSTICLPVPTVYQEEGAHGVGSFLAVLTYLILATLVGVITVARHRLTIVLGIFAFPQGLVAVLVGQLTHRRTIVMTDGGDVDVLLGNSLVRPLLLASFRLATVVTTLNRVKASRLISLGTESEICPTFGVDTSRFEYVPMAQKDQLLLFVGRLSSEKRPDFLLKALEILSRRGLFVKVLMVGEGPLGKRIRDTLQNSDRFGLVTLVAAVPHSEIHLLYRRSAIFILPSVREGVSLALLEAMSSGCLCIVSDIPDNKQVIQHGVNGITFKTSDEEDLANKIQWAISQPPSQLVDVTARARRTIELEYSLQTVGTGVSHILKL